MENIKNKFVELGNYLILHCDKSKDEYYYNIKGSLIDLPDYLIPQVLNSLREENENENVDDDTQGVSSKKSQLNEWAFVYGLDLSNNEIKNKTLEYLNELLEFKK